MHRFLQAVLAVLLVGITLVGPVSAAPAGSNLTDTTITTCNEPTFDSAVSAGGNITFNCGGPATITLTSPVPVTHDPTSIDGGGIITLTDVIHTRLLNVNSGVHLSLRHILLDKGDAGVGDGGAIANGGILSLDHVTIQNSVAGGAGGGIYTTGPVSIQASNFFTDSAGNGGGIYASGAQAVITVQDSLFSKDSGQTIGGGAVYLGQQAQLHVIGGSMSHNLAAAGGGAIFMDQGASATLESDAGGPAYLYFNHSNDSGGAIYNQGGTLALRGADLEYNLVPTNTISVGYGGAVASLGRLDVTDSRFANNQAQFGGGVFTGGSFFAAAAAITRTVFYANLAGSLGGGLYTNVNTTTVTIENSVFDSNKAPVGQGGGLARTNAHLTILKSSFSDNSAAYGGGMFLWGAPNPNSAGYVEIHDSTVSNNVATLQPSGGIENKADLNLRNVTIADNHAGLYDENGAVGRLQGSVLDNAPYADCAGDGTLPSSGGHNLATDSTCNLSAGLNDQIGVLAQLDALTSDPRFFTKFQPPLPGSPLLANAGPGCAASDQRYALRVGACDIGAIQLNGLLPRSFVPLVRK